MIELIFRLLVGHAVADFGLQSDWMAKNKNHNNKSDYIPPGQKYEETWFWVLGAHAFIHGGAVYWATGNPYLGFLETILHFFIDYAKCDNWWGPKIDQLCHLFCKSVYLIILS